MPGLTTNHALWLTAPWRFDPSLYSIIKTKLQKSIPKFLFAWTLGFNFWILLFVLLHCGVMKFLADMPSRLGGGDNRINAA
jgi:hypothetical protein